MRCPKGPACATIRQRTLVLPEAIVPGPARAYSLEPTACSKNGGVASKPGQSIHLAYHHWCPLLLVRTIHHRLILLSAACIFTTHDRAVVAAHVG